MPEIAERVDKLEQLAAHTQRLIQSLAFEVSRTQIAVNELSKEMKEFKDEMKRDSKNLKRELADVSKKMGTIVEDMVAPNIDCIAKKYFNLEKGKVSVRTKAYHSEDNSKRREFDVVAVYKDKVILNETKSNPKSEYAKEFAEFIKSKEFFKYFPEYKEKELIPIFASVYVSEDIVKYLSKQKIYVMGLGEDTMVLLNPKF